MSAEPDERLQRLLGGDHLAALRKRLRRRFELASPERARKDFRVNNLTRDEHRALAALSGHRPRFVRSLQIELSAVDDALRQAGIADSLHAALEQLDGPIVHLATARDEEQELWADVADRNSQTGLRQFLQVPTAMGLLKRLCGGDPDTADDLCDRVETVLRCLPANGLTRAQLAADTMGDAHALDQGRSVATLVLAVWRRKAIPATRSGIEDDRGEDGIERSLDTERARDVWARAGILVNELARPALYLNLPVRVNQGRATGEPGFMSLRRLVRRPPDWAVAGRDIYVCENPNVVAIAADRLGSRCPPMVCTDGMPAAAQSRMLNQLVRAGARLLYHGDFDWAGLQIGNTMMRVFDARPWRFGATDYLAALRVAPRPGHRLKGVEVFASWDEELMPAMKENQIGIAEEGVAASLLEDMERAANDFSEESGSV